MRVGILVFDGVEELDAVGVYEVLAKAKQIHPQLDLTVRFRALKEQITGALGMKFLAHEVHRELSDLDLVIVPGGAGRAEVVQDAEFVFTDQISVVDKVIPTLIPHKGETLCRTSAHWVQVDQDLGFRTHFLKVTDGNRMRVRRVQVIPEHDRITPSTRNFLIPLEVIARYYVAGSFHD